MKSNRSVKALLFVNIVVTMLIIMNFTELMSRLTYMSDRVHGGGYKYSKQYCVYVEFASIDKDDMNRGYQIVDELLCDMEMITVNATIPLVRGLINNGVKASCTIFLSIEEEPSFELEKGSYDNRHDKGVYIGNRYVKYVNNNEINVLGANFPVLGVIQGVGFNKSNDVLIKYKDLNNELRSENVSEWWYGDDGTFLGMCFLLDLGSNVTELRQAEVELLSIIDKYPEVSYKEIDYSTAANRKLGNAQEEAFTNLKQILYVVAMIFCIISTIYIFDLYMTSKKKDIAISYALGLNKGTMVCMIIKDVMPMYVIAIVTSVMLELFIYVFLQGFRAKAVLVYALYGIVGTLMLYLIIIRLVFFKMNRNNIVKELEGE